MLRYFTALIGSNVMEKNEEVRVPIKRGRGRPPKKKKIDIVEKKKEVKKEERKKVEKIKKKDNIKKTKRGNMKKGVFHHLINIIITASIVGGVIYLWQQSTGEEVLNSLKTETRDARREFENKIKMVKDKLKGAEYENSELKTVNEKLKSKASLLDEAVRNFKDSNLGFSFNYPAIFGDVDYTITDGETGKIFRGKFLENNNLVFGGSSKLLIGSSTPVNTILNVKGFNVDKDGVYRFNNDSKDEEVLFVPIEIMEISNGVEIVLVDYSSLVVKKEVEDEISKKDPDFLEDENSKDVTENESEKEDKETDVKKIDEADAEKEDTINIFQDLEDEKMVAAIVNLNSEEFNGLVFLNKNINELTMVDFKAVLETIVIK